MADNDPTEMARFWFMLTAVGAAAYIGVVVFFIL